MKSSTIKRGIGFALAFFLAMSPALGWNCCCSTSEAAVEATVAVQEESGHGCCPESGTKPAQVSATSAECGCPETIGNPLEAAGLAATVPVVEFKDSKAPFTAVLFESPQVILNQDGGAGRIDAPPPRLLTYSHSSASSRAPPASC